MPQEAGPIRQQLEHAVHFDGAGRIQGAAPRIGGGFRLVRPGDLRPAVLAGRLRPVLRATVTPATPPSLPPTPTPTPMPGPRAPSAMLRIVAGRMLPAGGLVARGGRLRSFVVADGRSCPAMRRPTLLVAMTVSQESKHSQAKRGDGNPSGVTAKASAKAASGSRSACDSARGGWRPPLVGSPPPHGTRSTAAPRDGVPGPPGVARGRGCFLYWAG
jgi:hypothetical protein